MGEGELKLKANSLAGGSAVFQMNNITTLWRAGDSEDESKAFMNVVFISVPSVFRGVEVENCKQSLFLSRFAPWRGMAEATAKLF